MSTDLAVGMLIGEDASVEFVLARSDGEIKITPSEYVRQSTPEALALALTNLAAAVKRWYDDAKRYAANADHHRERAEKHGGAEHRLGQEVIKLRRQVEALERNLGAVTAAKIVIVDPEDALAAVFQDQRDMLEEPVRDLLGEILAYVKHPTSDNVHELAGSLVAGGMSEAEAIATIRSDLDSMESALEADADAAEKL